MRQRIRAELGVGEQFTFLIAGRLHPEKGYEHLFEAIRLLKGRAGRPFVLLSAGCGPFLERYQHLVSTLAIADRVRFLGFRDDLPDLMTGAIFSFCLVWPNPSAWSWRKPSISGYRWWRTGWVGFRKSSMTVSMAVL